MFFFFYNLHIALKNIGRITYTIAFIWCKTVLVNLSLDIICSSRLTVFLPLRSRRTVRLLEQIESAQNFAPCIKDKLHISYEDQPPTAGIPTYEVLHIDHQPDIVIKRSISRWWSCRILFTWSLCVVSRSFRRLFSFVKLSISRSAFTCFISRCRLCSSFSFTATSWFSYCRLRFSSTPFSFYWYPLTRK